MHAVSTLAWSGVCLRSSVLNPVHWPLLYRWERYRVIGARSSCLRRLYLFLPQLNRGADHKHTNEMGILDVMAEINTYYTPCTRHSFPLSPGRETREGVSVRPQSPRGTVFACHLTGGPIGPT